MKMFSRKYSDQERRRYIRLDSVFPVQFRLLTLDGKSLLSDWLQGFTNNISKGGLCLAINNLSPEFAQILEAKQAKLALKIEMPLLRSLVSATAKVAWMEKDATLPKRYLIGLSYDEINPCQNNKLMHYAWTKKLFVPVTVSIILIFALAFGVTGFINAKLIKGNKALVAQLINIVQESSIAKQKVKVITKEREELQIKLQPLELHMQRLEEERRKLKGTTAGKLGEFNTLINQLESERCVLQEQLIALQNKESDIVEELLRLDKRKALLEKANLEKMYEWLRRHQHPTTGLVMSFEGDKNVQNLAFTYDEALAIQVYTYFADFSQAKKILDFFKRKAKRIEGKFINAYYLNDGNPAEDAVYIRANIELGIAALKYMQKSQDRSYLHQVEEIATTIITLQNQDLNGAIRWDKNIASYSVEDNLVAYAFFNILYKFTGKPEYAKAQEKVLNWLVPQILNKTQPSDSYIWSLASLGPEKLEKLGINPDRIIEFTEENFTRVATYTRPEGQVIKVRGFDFSRQKDIAKSEVVSCESTAKMVLALKIMADFYHKKNMIAKARGYETKADEYLADLSNMVIFSTSPYGQGQACMPYATQRVDTGYGWMTPEGARGGSVAGTVYTIFAYYKYNPLEP